MIIVVGDVRLAPGEKERFMSAAKTMVAASREEAGCHQYSYFEDLWDKNIIHAYEEWEDEDALAQHFQTAHMRVFVGALGSLNIVSRDIRKYQAGPGKSVSA